MPLPNIIIADHDMSSDAGSPFPGGGRIQCVQLGAGTAARSLRTAIKLGQLALDLFP